MELVNNSAAHVPSSTSPTMNLQLQSPLFGKIPAEIRNEIFDLALKESYIPGEEYERETYYTRPGFLGKKKVHTELLRTCKRVYEETKTVPFRDLEVCFWLGNRERTPPGIINFLFVHILCHFWERRTPIKIYGGYVVCGFRFEHCNADKYPECMTARNQVQQLPRNNTFSAAQWGRIKYVRVIPQMYAFNSIHLPGIFQTYPSNRYTYGSRIQLTPTMVTVTFRYTDWWFWEDNAPLKLGDEYHEGRNWKYIKFPESVEKVVMELETREGKKKELEHLIQRIFRNSEAWIFKRNDGKVLRVKDGEGAVGEWAWSGPTKFRPNERFPHHGDEESMRYVVKVLMWVVDENYECREEMDRQEPFGFPLKTYYRD